MTDRCRRVVLMFIVTLSWQWLMAATAINYEHRTTNDPLSIHIAVVDPVHVKIVAARAYDRGLGRETVSSMARRKGAVLAINGGFFRIGGHFDGQPVGVLKIGNEWYSDTYRQRGAVGWRQKSDQVLFDRLDMEWSVFFEDTEVVLTGLNRKRSADDRILFTPAFGSVALTDSGGLELQVNGHSVVSSRGSEGKMEIPERGFVVSLGAGSNADYRGIEIGTHADLQYRFHPSLDTAHEQWRDMDFIVGGTPILVKDGRILGDWKEERVQESFVIERHPRTAVGVREDGKWVFVVVDGRRPAVSLGATLPALAKIMVELGCVEALNLDGGGSSTMFLYGKVVNLPSDLSGERPVSDAILVLEEAADF